MHILWLIILANFINGLISLIGIFSFLIKEKLLQKILLVLVAFSAGTLLSGALFHLIAESLENLTPIATFSCLLIGFSVFFILEKFLYWHHCHEKKCSVHPVTYLITIGDGIHNFIDGVIIGTSFMVDVSFGVITTLVIICHEIPQELGDFAVLVHGGFSKTKALVYNLISQSICVVGGVFGYFLSNSVEGILQFILPFAAGSFIYISASDLVPELHKEHALKNSLITFCFFVIGILFMLAMKFVFEH